MAGDADAEPGAGDADAEAGAGVGVGVGVGGVSGVSAGVVANTDTGSVGVAPPVDTTATAK